MRRVLTAFLLTFGISASAHAQIGIGIGDVLGGLGIGGPKAVYDSKALAQALLLYKEAKAARKIAEDEALFVRGMSARGVMLYGVGKAAIGGNCSYGLPWTFAINNGRLVDQAYDYTLARLQNLGCGGDAWTTPDHVRAAARNRVLEDLLKNATADAGQSRQNAGVHELNYEELQTLLGTVQDPKATQKDLLRLIAYAVTVHALAQRDVNRNTLAQTQLLAAQITEQAEMNRSLLNAELYRRALLNAPRSAVVR